MHFRTSIRFRIVAAALAALAALSGSACSEKLTPPSPPEDTAVSGRAALLATVPEGDKPPAQGAASASHLPYGSIQDFFFSQNGRTVAYSVRDSGYSYASLNGKPGKIYRADVAPVVLSPGGTRYAYPAPVGAKWRMVIDGVEGADYDQVREPEFSPDGRHVAYTALKEGAWGLVVDDRWHPGNSKQRGRHLFSGDSSRLAFLEEVGEHEEGRLVVADPELRGRRVVLPGGVGSIVGNRDKNRVAAVVSAEGQRRVVTFSFADPGEVKAGAPYDLVSNLVFAPDGVTVAYTAEKNHTRYLVFGGRAEAAGVAEFREPPVVRPDLKAVGALMAGADDRPYLREFFSKSTEQPKRYDGACFLSYSRDGVPAFAAASLSRKAWFLVVGGHEGPLFDRVVDPRFTPDGRFVVYRARKDGKRFVVVADRSGRTIRQHPAHEQVFEVHFTSDGRVAYGVKDGLKLSWMVEPL